MDIWEVDIRNSIKAAEYGEYLRARIGLEAVKAVFFNICKLLSFLL